MTAPKFTLHSGPLTGQDLEGFRQAYRLSDAMAAWVLLGIPNGQKWKTLCRKADKEMGLHGRYRPVEILLRLFAARPDLVPAFPAVSMEELFETMKVSKLDFALMFGREQPATYRLVGGGRPSGSVAQLAQAVSKLPPDGMAEALMAAALQTSMARGFDVFSSGKWSAEPRASAPRTPRRKATTAAKAPRPKAPAAAKKPARKKSSTAAKDGSAA